MGLYHVISDISIHYTLDLTISSESNKHSQVLFCTLIAQQQPNMFRAEALSCPSEMPRHCWKHGNASSTSPRTYRVYPRF